MHRIIGRTVTVDQPTDDDLTWIMAELARAQVYEALGWKEGVGSEIYSGYIEETVLLLPFKNSDGERVGFIMLMRGDTESRVWSVNIVIPETQRRNGFTALAALDAMCHLVFDVRGDEGLVWMIEPSNGASRILPRRLGYTKLDDVERDGTTYERYGIGAEHWNKRKTKRGLSYEVQPVAVMQMAHGRIIAAVRGSSI